MAQHLNALTIASAKHLLSQGHITPQHHARIVKGIAPKAKRAAPVRGFGSLAPVEPAPVTPPGAAPVEE